TSSSLPKHSTGSTRFAHQARCSIRSMTFLPGSRNRRSGEARSALPFEHLGYGNFVAQGLAREIATDVVNDQVVEARIPPGGDRRGMRSGGDTGMTPERVIRR